MQVILTQEEYDALKGDKKKHATEGIEVFLKAFFSDAPRWRTESEWGVAPARSYVTIDDLTTAVSKARGAFDVWTAKL